MDMTLAPNENAQTALMLSKTEKSFAPAETHSQWLKYLPDMYSDGSLFLDGFLRIFESIWTPLDHQIDVLYAYFDPALAPSNFLPWLGTWVDLVLDENWPEARRRRLIQSAVDLYRRRGTASALSDYLTIFTGIQPVILEDGDQANPFHFTVTFRATDPNTLDQDRIRRIIEEEKPAHTTYTLKLETA